MKAGRPKPDQRAQGYTVVAISVFKSLEDFKYYDSECATHMQVKQFVKNVHEGLGMVYFENEI